MPALQDDIPLSRKSLRERLIAERTRFVDAPSRPAAEAALGGALRELLATLEPELLGLYWPVRSEFNAVLALRGDEQSDESPPVPPLALPYVRRTPPAMEYRRWDGQSTDVRDECRIVSSNGEIVVPDVVLVPCVGYTREGYRLGYGGGYFDRWLALHPGVTTLGIAWSAAELGLDDFRPEPHDQPLTLILTEQGVIG